MITHFYVLALSSFLNIFPHIEQRWCLRCSPLIDTPITVRKLFQIKIQLQWKFAVEEGLRTAKRERIVTVYACCRVKHYYYYYYCFSVSSLSSSMVKKGAYFSELFFGRKNGHLPFQAWIIHCQIVRHDVKVAGDGRYLLRHTAQYDSCISP
jgi:hypothetical protein